MNRTEMIRNEILNQCLAYRPLARDCERMAKQFHDCGELLDATAPEFERECVYLEGKGLVERVRQSVAQDHILWRITSAGVDHMERQGHRI